MDTIALSRSLLDSVQGEADLTRRARSYAQRGRELLFERHRAGAGGLEIVSAYTTIIDHLVRHLFTVAAEEYQQHHPAEKLRCAVVAQGGYGRGELNPQSDLDLYFLHVGQPTPFVQAVAKKLYYTLMDAGFTVGHALRTNNDSMRLAEADMKVRTALLDSRFLCGDYGLYGVIERDIEKRLLRKQASRFVAEKLAESKQRHAEYGGSVYLLEPEVKEGEGGLRDIHTARWLARVLVQAKDLEDVALKGIVAGADVAKLKEAQNFLLRVRNELHFSTGKHQDQLTFEHQEKVSDALGFQGEEMLRGVEVFMRRYYLHAVEISRITNLIIHRMTKHKRPLFAARYSFGRNLRLGVRVTKSHMSVTKPEIFQREPSNLIRLFEDMQKHGYELAHETREVMRAHLGLIDEEYRRSAEANLPFFSILKWKERVYETLSEMHQCGVLGAFIPEFGRLLCMVLHDAYHTYTVDQHSLRLVMEIEQLKAGDHEKTLPLLTQLAREADKIELLYLGLLFHDIGKGLGGGHSEVGAEMVRPIAKRMKLNADDGALVEFLVRHHLLMTHTAFRRDLEDEKTIFDFAKTMGNVRNLQMLYLLTFADVKGVGPDVWNPWKASLLGELYVKTLNLLEEAEKGELQRQDVRAVVRRIQTRLRKELAKDGAAERVDAFLEIMPDRYFLSTPENDVAGHFRLMESYDGDGAVVDVQHFPERACSSVVICTQDRPGLFASITGALTALGLDIVNARIFTANDGRIIDVFRIAHRGKRDAVMNEQKWGRFRATLNSVLAGKTDVAKLVEGSRRSILLQKRVPKVSTVVRMDNEASDGFTIVEVFTDDRIGVLFTITHTLYQLGLSIHVAKISTNVDQVADVFYVTDERGGKVLDPGRLEAARDALQRILAPQNEPSQRVA
ncbi:MAG: [protein-PII] uridylyltransferase [Deltaproteobacteria bacterium]|nr:[protein-PII] uridylyltransferase [Deltaproteobacteria bacterium]